MNKYWLDINEMKEGTAYLIQARNACVGIWRSDKKCFEIPRTKFSSNYLCQEHHWDTGAPHGTAKPIMEIHQRAKKQILDDEDKLKLLNKLSIKYEGEVSRRLALIFKNNRTAPDKLTLQIGTLLIPDTHNITQEIATSLTLKAKKTYCALHFTSGQFEAMANITSSLCIKLIVEAVKNEGAIPHTLTLTKENDIESEINHTTNNKTAKRKTITLNTFSACQLNERIQHKRLEILDAMTKLDQENGLQ